MDADDISLPHRFKTQVDFLDNNPEIALIGSSYYRIDAQNKIYTLSRLLTDPQDLKENLKIKNWFAHGSVMIRKKLLLDLGGYDERYKCTQDYDLWLRASEKHPIANLDEPMYCWRTTESCVSFKQDKEQQYYANLARTSAADRRTQNLSCATSTLHNNLYDKENILQTSTYQNNIALEKDADFLYNEAVKNLNQGDLQTAVNSFDNILENVDPLHLNTIDTLRKLEQKLDKKWLQIRENFYINKYKNEINDHAALLAAQFNNSEKIMKLLHDNLKSSQAKEIQIDGKDLISIIVPCYNEEANIHKTLQSIFNQTYKKWEIIVVDDGSKDRTSEIVQHIKEKNPKYDIKLIHQANKGLASARNKGGYNAQGDYLVFIDGNDEILPAFLSETHQAMHENPHCGWVYPVTLQYGEANRFWSFSDFSLWLLPSKNLHPVTNLLKKEVFLNVNGFDENMVDGYEDWDFWLSAARKGYQGKLCKKVLFVYFKRQNSMLEKQRAEGNELKAKLQLISNNKDFYKSIERDEKEILRDKLRIDMQLINAQYIQQLEKQTEVNKKAAGPIPSDFHNKQKILVVQFYVYKNVHWPMFENLYHYLKSRDVITEIILCLPCLPQLIGAQNYTLIDKLFSLDATITTSPYAKKVDITFIADAFAGKVQGCGKIVNIGHGTISKGYYFTENVWTERENWVDLLCVPGKYAQKQFKECLSTKVAATGMPKLDPVFSGEYDRTHLCELLKLNPDNIIILYAPTFNTDLSSVYIFKDQIAELAASNRYVLIKLHGTTLPNTVVTYQNLAEKHQNIFFIDDSNIAPYIGGSDIMISDVSSAFMEFMALDKPVILYNNPNQKKYHSYNPENIEYKWRDLGTEINSFDELKYKLDIIIQESDHKSSLRKTYAKTLFADLNGNASKKVWAETKQLLKQNTTPVTPPVFSDIVIISDENLFTIRELIHNIQFHSSMPHELVLINTSTSQEVSNYLRILKNFNQFKNIILLPLDKHTSRDKCILEGIKNADGDIILIIDDGVGIYKCFDYIIHKTYQKNPGVSVLTGLNNMDSKEVNFQSYIKQDQNLPFDRLAFDLINLYNCKEIKDLAPQTLPPLFALKKHVLLSENLSSLASFQHFVISHIKICLSLLYTTVHTEDMLTIKSYWINRGNTPKEQRIQIAKNILKNYMYPDIAENLFNDLLAFDSNNHPNISLATKSLYMRYYDIGYKKKLRSLFNGIPQSHDILDKDIKILEKLTNTSETLDLANIVPSGSKKEKHRVLFYFFKNVHIPILVPIYIKLKKNYPEIEIAFGYMKNAPQIRAGFTKDELQSLEAFGEKMFTAPQEFTPDLTFIADSVYPWVEGCGKLVNVGHGVLSKGQYYTDTETARREEQADLVCVPGSYHEQIMNQIISTPVSATGMAKLDAVFAKTVNRQTVLKQFGLPAGYRYILFAPTFNDELSAIPFVMDRINEIIPDEQTILIIKLHGSTKQEYKGMYKSLVQKDKRIIFADELDITPFLALCDLMISDVSSAMMEFAALDKPIVLYNNPNWKSYQNYNPDDIEFKWRDIGIQVTSLEEMKNAVKQSLAHAEEFSEKRKFYTDQLFANKNNGKAADRIIESALDLLSDKTEVKGAA